MRISRASPLLFRILPAPSIPTPLDRHLDKLCTFYDAAPTGNQPQEVVSIANFWRSLSFPSTLTLPFFGVKKSSTGSWPRSACNWPWPFSNRPANGAPDAPPGQKYRDHFHRRKFHGSHL